MTPLPLLRLSIVGLILFVNNASVWMIYSFLPFMVQHYFPSLSEGQLGYYAGMLGSAFSFGSLIGSVLWGVAADKYGRRPILLSGLCGTFASMCVFAFAPNFAVAVVARFMWGLLNGNVGVAKTYVGEILDDTNQAKGMSLFAIIGGLGRTIGPVIGGFLYDPASKYSVFRHSGMMKEFPALLPTGLMMACCFSVWVAGWLFLKESYTVKLSSNSASAATGVASRSVLSSRGGRNGYMRLESKDTEADEAEASAVSAEELEDDGDVEMTRLIPEPSPRASPITVTESAGSPPLSSSPLSLSSSSFEGAVKRKLVRFGEVLHHTFWRDESPSKQKADEAAPARCEIELEGDTGRLPDHDHDEEEGGDRSDGRVIIEMGRKSLLQDDRLVKSDTESDKFREGGGIAEEGDEERKRGDDDRCEELAVARLSSRRSAPLRPILKMGPATPPRQQPAPAESASTAHMTVMNTLYNRSLSQGYVFPEQLPESRRQRKKRNFMLELLSKKEILISTSLYAIIGLCNMTVSEVVPLWVVTPIKDGGLNFDSNQIGLTIALTGPAQILSQIFIYPLLIDRLGVLNVCKLGIYAYAAAVAIMPWITHADPTEHKALVWTLLVVVMMMANVAAMWGFTSVFVLINNSCYKRERATVNGIGQSLASVGRMTGPIAGGNVFAWSETNGMSWPFNYHFTFYMIALCSLGGSWLASLLPESISRRKVEPDELQNPAAASSSSARQR